MKRLILLLVLLFPAFFLYAFENPVSKYETVTGFGEIKNGALCTGTVFRADEVLASRAGEIIYYSDSMLILDHGDNIRTLYSGIRPLIPADGKNTVSAGETIGKSVNGSFLFEIYDTELRQYINPLLMTGGKKDRTGPVLRSAELNGESGKKSLMTGRETVNHGSYELGFVSNEVPYRVTVIMNGITVYDKMNRTVKPSQPLPSGIKLELIQGITVINLELSDFYGNKSCKNIVLEVK